MKDGAASILAGAGALVLYLLLAPSAVGDKDAAEFTLVLATGGVAHPTGYPLYTLLGHPFVLLLHGLGLKWAFAANAWSALGGGVAVALLHRLARGLVGDARLRALFAWLPVLLFGLNPIWTFETTLAETGSWHVAWVCGAALLCLNFLKGLGARGPVSAAQFRRGAAAWGLVCGLGMAHHVTALFVAAPLTIALWLATRRNGDPARMMLPALAGFILPLTSYGFVAWRAFHPGFVQWPLLAPTWTAVLDHLTAAQYMGYFGHYSPAAGQAHYLAVYVYPFLALSALALAVALRSAAPGPERRLLMAVAAAVAIQGAFIFGYGVPDPSSYFLPVLALGLVAVAPATARAVRSPAASRQRATLTGAALVLALSALGVPWFRTGWERRETYIRHEQLLRRMWESVTVERGFLLWADDMSHVLRTWQILDGEKPGIVVINPAMLTHEWPRRQFERAHGFDPLQNMVMPGAPSLMGADSDVRVADLIDQMARNINALSALPVVVFDPSGPSVRLIRESAPQ